MAGEIALDTSIAIQYLNGNPTVVNQVTTVSIVVLPVMVVGELLFGAENSTRRLKNLTNYLQFINTCTVIPMGRDTATVYSQIRLSLKRKGLPIPENDLWIASQCLENGWKLATNDGHFTYIDKLIIERWIQ